MALHRGCLIIKIMWPVLLAYLYLNLNIEKGKSNQFTLYNVSSLPSLRRLSFTLINLILHIVDVVTLIPIPSYHIASENVGTSRHRLS